MRNNNSTERIPIRRLWPVFKWCFQIRKYCYTNRHTIHSFIHSFIHSGYFYTWQIHTGRHACLHN